MTHPYNKIVGTILFSVLITCVPLERPLPVQDTTSMHFELEPANVPVVPKKECRKHWDLLTPTLYNTSLKIGCDVDYMKMQGCFAWYCDETMCSREFDDFFDCEVEYYKKLRNTQP